MVDKNIKIKCTIFCIYQTEKFNSDYIQLKWEMVIFFRNINIEVQGARSILSFVSGVTPRMLGT